MTESTTDWRDRDDLLAPGERSDLDSCDRESIHLIPYCQPSGAIVIVADDGRVLSASTNVGDFVAQAHHDLVGHPIADSLARLGTDLDGLLDGDIAGSSIDGERVEVRAHRSRTGPIVIEYASVEPSRVGEDAGAIVEILDALRSARTVDDLLQATAEAVRSVLGFDRIWVYRFDDEANGEIVAEAIADGAEAFLGLRFGEGDIPAQARALYLENRVRVVRDTGDSVPIEPRQVNGDTWVDLSDAALRAVSPIHRTYLRNMGVDASASLAIVVDDELWGLVSGHNASGPRLIDRRTERIAAIVADVVSMQVAALEAAERNALATALERHAGSVLAAVAGAESVLDGLCDAPDALMALADASGCAIRMAQRKRFLGRTPPADVVDGLIDHLQTLGEDVVVSECGADLYPPLADHAVVGAGVLALSMGRDPGNWIVWFRPERLESVTYGDRSDLHVERDELSPRNSFAKYAAEVSGRSEPWPDAALAAVGALRSSLGTIVFQRSEQLARTMAALRSANDELDRFAYVAAHDLKEPLRGIYNYIEILEEDHADVLPDDATELLGSVRRLSLRMSDLVESLLVYATVGRQRFQPEAFTLGSLVADARDFLRVRSAETAGTIDVVDPDVEVFADRSQLVQVMTNLLSNALKYHRPGAPPSVTIRTSTLGDTERGWDSWPQHNLDIPPPMVISVSDDGIGIDPARAEEIFEVFRRLHGRDEYGGGSGAGLTIARRIAERHGGALWVEPNHPSGSTFHLALSRVLGASSD